MVIFTDASFENAKESWSQLGFVIALVDKARRANIVHFVSQRCKRLKRSVMALELHTLILGFDFVFIIRNLLEEILDRKVPIDAYVDRKTVLDVTDKDGKTTERILQKDIFALRESYARGEM